MQLSFAAPAFGRTPAPGWSARSKAARCTGRGQKADKASGGALSAR